MVELRRTQMEDHALQAMKDKLQHASKESMNPVRQPRVFETNDTLKSEIAFKIAGNQ